MNLLNFVNKKLDERGSKVFSTGIKMMHYNSFQYGFTETFINTLFLLPIGYYVFQFIKTGQGVEVIVMIAAIQSKIAELGRQMMGLMTELACTGADLTRERMEIRYEQFELFILPLADKFDLRLISQDDFSYSLV